MSTSDDTLHHWWMYAYHKGAEAYYAIKARDWLLDFAEDVQREFLDPKPQDRFPEE